jgi:hypothetical protein
MVCSECMGRGSSREEDLLAYLQPKTKPFSVQAPVLFIDLKVFLVSSCLV